MSPISAHTPPVNVHALHTKDDKSTGLNGRSWTGYRVQPGETLSSLAARFDTTVSALAARNKISDPAKRIFSGQNLMVPGARPTKSVATKPAAASSKAKKSKPAVRSKGTRYTVRPGDTMTSIASAHHVSLATLLKANRIADPSRLQAGDAVSIPGAATAAAAPAPKQAAALSVAERTFLNRTYSEAVVRGANATRAALAKMPAPSRTQTRAMIEDTARKHGVNPKLALGIGWQESGWNQHAVSVCNAIGTMQVMPDSGVWASSLAHQQLNLLDAQDNITAGVTILRWLTTHADNLDQAIAGYYQGLGGVQKNGMYPDTRAYVRSVHAHMARF